MPLCLDYQRIYSDRHEQEDIKGCRAWLEDMTPALQIRVFVFMVEKRLKG